MLAEDVLQLLRGVDELLAALAELVPGELRRVAGALDADPRRVELVVGRVVPSRRANIRRASSTRVATTSRAAPVAVSAAARRRLEPVEQRQVALALERLARPPRTRDALALEPARALAAGRCRRRARRRRRATARPARRGPVPGRGRRPASEAPRAATPPSRRRPAADPRAGTRGGAAWRRAAGAGPRDRSRGASRGRGQQSPVLLPRARPSASSGGVSGASSTARRHRRGRGPAYLRPLVAPSPRPPAASSASRRRSVSSSPPTSSPRPRETGARPLAVEHGDTRSSTPRRPAHVHDLRAGAQPGDRARASRPRRWADSSAVISTGGRAGGPGQLELDAGSALRQLQLPQAGAALDAVAERDPVAREP